MDTRYRKEPFTDVDRTLAVMAEFARAEQTSPEVRRAADSLTRGLGHNEERDEIALKVWKFLDREIRYLPDPSGTELVQSPTAVLESGHADCDGLATLAASILSALGIESGFRVVAWETEGVYEHVYAIYAPTPGAPVQEWHALDPVGASPAPGPDTIRAQGVADKAYTLATHADKNPPNMPNLTDQTPMRALGQNGTGNGQNGSDDGAYEFDSFAEFAAYAIGQGPDYIEAWKNSPADPAPNVSQEQLLRLLAEARNRQQQAGLGQTGTVLLSAGAMVAVVYAATR